MLRLTKAMCNTPGLRPMGICQTNQNINVQTAGIVSGNSDQRLWLSIVRANSGAGRIGHPPGRSRPANYAYFVRRNNGPVGRFRFFAGHRVFEPLDSDENGSVAFDTISLLLPIFESGLYVHTVLNLTNGCVARDSVLVNWDEPIGAALGCGIYPLFWRRRRQD